MKIRTYTNLSYRPQKNDLVAEYLVKSPLGLSAAANHLAAESSIGTWTDISTMDERIAARLRPSVFEIRKKQGIVKIAYPSELFEAGNMPQIWSSIAGNIFGMKAVSSLRLLDVQFPKRLVSSFRGPRYGVLGIRKITGVRGRPLVGTIVKPKVGLGEKAHAKVAYDAWTGGLDIVKDDENLTSMKFNSFRTRMEETFKLRDRAEKETGEKKIYMPNITAETLEMIRRADIVHDFGGEYVMVDILTCGWSGLQTVRKNVRKVIHGHRAMHAALTRNPEHGISMLTIAKCARLVGCDQLHIGTATVGKMNETGHECLDIEKEMGSRKSPAHAKVLGQRWHSIKPVLSVASGGLHPGSVPALTKKLGKNIVMQFGGGVHGHPDGTFAGAMAVRQAVDAVQRGISLKRHAAKHPELSRALQKFC